MPGIATGVTADHQASMTMQQFDRCCPSPFIQPLYAAKGPAFYAYETTKVTIASNRRTDDRRQITSQSDLRSSSRLRKKWIDDWGFQCQKNQSWDKSLRIRAVRRQLNTALLLHLSRSQRLPQWGHWATRSPTHSRMCPTRWRLRKPASCKIGGPGAHYRAT